MDARYEKFTASRQEPLRLAIALEDWLRTPNAAHRAAYEAYLLRRLRPAAAELVRQEETQTLDALHALSPFSPALIDELVALAAKEQRSAALVWLLQQKQRSHGFTPRHYSL